MGNSVEGETPAPAAAPLPLVIRRGNPTATYHHRGGPRSTDLEMVRSVSDPEQLEALCLLAANLRQAPLLEALMDRMHAVKGAAAPYAASTAACDGCGAHPDVCAALACGDPRRIDAALVATAADARAVHDALWYAALIGNDAGAQAVLRYAYARPQSVLAHFDDAMRRRVIAAARDASPDAPVGHGGHELLALYLEAVLLDGANPFLPLSMYRLLRLPSRP